MSNESPPEDGSSSNSWPSFNPLKLIQGLMIGKEHDTHISYPSPHQREATQMRWMIRRDLAEVLDIERQSFDFAWTEEDFLRCLRQRNCIGMVAERQERILGFMMYELFKSQIHVLNLAVAPWIRRDGVGSDMTRRLVDKLSHMRRTEIRLEVREGNLPGQLFFRSQGFMATNVLRNYYDDTTEDAYVMKYFKILGKNADVPPFIACGHNRISEYEAA